MNALELWIGGQRFRVEAEDPALLDTLAARYRPFSGPAGGAVDPAAVVRLQLDGAAEPHNHPAPPAVFSGGRVLFDLPGYRGAIEPGGAAQLAIASPAPVLGIDYFLRVVVGARVFAAGGLMLHAAGIVRRGRAYLFFGRSGSGKTTAARNSPGGLVLNDDLVVLHPADGGWTAWGTPFTNPTQAAPSPDHAPAAALLHLVQSPVVQIEPLRGARALAELLACVPVLNGAPEPPLDRVRRLLDDVPAFDLHLRADSSFWAALDSLDG